MTCGADLNPYEDRYLGNMILWTPYVSKPFSITWSTVGCFVTYSFILFFLAMVAHLAGSKFPDQELSLGPSSECTES